jgi:hypothetical protein
MACCVTVVDGSGVNEAAPIHGDFPGSQVTAARKTGIHPQTAFENLGMMAMVEMNKQLKTVPVRYHHPIQFNQSPLLVFRLLENFLEPAHELFLAGDTLGGQVLLTLFLD